MDKMREEFEVWFSQFENQSAIQRRAAWNAWKASRAALCVDLPADISGEYYADGWNSALASVEEVLNDCGVAFK